MNLSQINKYIGRQVLAMILLVLAALVALDVVFTFIRELGFLRGDYQEWQALQFSLTTTPRRFYEFIPIASLIGCLIGLGLLASSSELVAMRAAGVSIVNILVAVLRPVAVLVVLGLLLGQYVVPVSEKLAQSNRSLAEAGGRSLRAEFGHWYRDGQDVVHAEGVLPNGVLFGITRYVFDETGQLKELVFAQRATYQKQGLWFMEAVRHKRIEQDRVSVTEEETGFWQSQLTPDILNLVVLKPNYLSISDLYRFARQREREGLDARQYHLAFWQKIFQPLMTFAMVVLAAGFVFGPLRSVSMGLRVLVGVATGLGFRYLQEFFSQLSLVFGLSPGLAALLPVICCLLAAGYILYQRR